MALKSTIFKAALQIADIDHGYYADHALTLARHPSETDERMMIRLAALALNAYQLQSVCNGDGTLGDGDSPIAGADVYAGYFSTRFVGDEFHTTTAADGSFVLSLPEGSAQLTDLFVEVAIPTESPNGTAHRSAVSRRVTVTAGTGDALVGFTSLPARCGEPPLPACGVPRRSMPRAS